MSIMVASHPQSSFTPFSQGPTEAPSGRYRMLIASVQALLREGLRSAFESRSECTAVLEAGSLSEVAWVLEQRVVDIVLLDCDLVGHLAATFLQSPMFAEAGVPILILASPAKHVLAKQLLMAGAAGLVWNRSGIQDLRTGIREAMRRRTWRDCRALRPREPSQSIAPPPWGRFTDRQKRVIQGLLRGRANKEIAFDLSVTETLIKCTMRQLFAKTNTHSRAQLVMILMEQIPMDGLNELEWSATTFKYSKPANADFSADAKRPVAGPCSNATYTFG